MFFRTRVFIGLGVAIALTLGALAAAGWPSKPDAAPAAAEAVAG